jgi:nucleoid DNA-binding protein
MRRIDFIGRVSSLLDGATRKDVKAVLEATGYVLKKDVINKKERVKLFDYLYISGYEKECAIRKNLYTGGKVEVPSHIKPKAEFTKSFKRSYWQD